MRPALSLRRSQRGAVAVVVALCLVAMFASLGLVIDLGRMFVTKTELSNAADACALAAAAELKPPIDLIALTRAESAATTVGQRNAVDFQGTPVVVVPDSTVTFSDHLNGVYLAKNSIAVGSMASMKYAKCELQQTGILPLFMQTAGFGPQTVASHAVASLIPGITNCGLPVAMCQVSPPPSSCPGGGTPDASGFCVGQWYTSRFSAGGGFTGSFNLIDYSPPSGGASELAALLAGAGQCNLNVSQPVGQTGIQQSIAQAWNTRFGLYHGSYDIANNPPDFTGYAYTPATWPGQFDAFGGAGTNFPAARASNLVYQGDATTGLNLTGGYTNSTPAQLAASGADRRLATVPVVDCAGWVGSQTVPILRMACILMLHPMEGPNSDVRLEYQGLSDAPGNPCATIGLPGGPGSVGPKVPGLVR
jgi:Putative Flp pilus-assembly TadE/G-like